jgi:DNA-binding SARP family transcriptional activator
VARRALSAGDAARVVEPLAQLVTVDPYYEEGHSLLIKANETLGARPERGMGLPVDMGVEVG